MNAINSVRQNKMKKNWNLVKGKKTVSYTHLVKNTPAQSLEESIHIANIILHCIGPTDIGVIILHPRLNPTIDGFLYLLQMCALPNRVNWILVQ